MPVLFIMSPTKQKTNIPSQGLTLEQVDKMMDETTPRTSTGWKAKTTFAEDLGMTSNTGGNKMNAELVNDVERKGSVF